MPKSYKKKPIVVDVMQWTGDNLPMISDWIGVDKVYGPLPPSNSMRPNGDKLQVWCNLLREWLFLDVGDWITKDEHGFFAVSSEHFHKQYILND